MEVVDRYNNGQVKYRKTITGKEIWYDEAGHVTCMRHPNGTEDIRKYNKAGICIYFKSAAGNEYKYTDFNKPLYKKTHSTEEWWEYNEDGKCITHTTKEYF